jgi:hypothetical protein
MALPSALPPPPAVSSQEKTKSPLAMRTEYTLYCFSERTGRNYPSIETQDCRQIVILEIFSSYLEKLRQKPRVLLSCRHTHTHTHTLSLSLSLSLSLCAPPKIPNTTTPPRLPATTLLSHKNLQCFLKKTRSRTATKEP